MYCSICGKELPENTNFCTNCGTVVTANQKTDHITAEQALSITPTQVKKNTWDDKISDKIVGKIVGKKVETIRISMEDILELLKKHFIIPASTDKDYQEIQKTVNGGLIGVKSLVSKDGAYTLSVSVAMQLCGRINLLHPSDSNWICFTELSTGKVYQYSAFTWGKFKKAVKNAIAEERRLQESYYYCCFYCDFDIYRYVRKRY